MPFWQLTVGTSPDTSEGLANFLWEQGALGVLEEQVHQQPAHLRAFFPETASSTGLLGAVREYRASLRSLGFAVDAEDPEISPLFDEAWASAWQQSFPPRAIGDRLLVRPPWALGNAVDAERLQVVIEPGRAFGTGHHASTEGCLALLDRALARRPGARVLDLGTGSGILAIAAVKLGAADVLAIDVDPDATAAAAENLERNDCADRVAVRLCRPEEIAGPFPVVVANLLGHTHVALRSSYARLVAIGGDLILGGILADEDTVVIEALTSAGFALRTRLVLDGWSSLLLARAPVPALGR